jgi:hypothetical protein
MNARSNARKVIIAGRSNSPATAEIATSAHAFALNDRNCSLRTQFSRKNQTEESEIYRYIAKLLATSEFYAVPHLGVKAAIESQTSLGLLNKRVDQIGGGLGQVNCSFQFRERKAL